MRSPCRYRTTGQALATSGWRDEARAEAELANAELLELAEPPLPPAQLQAVEWVPPPTSLQEKSTLLPAGQVSSHLARALEQKSDSAMAPAPLPVKATPAKRATQTRRRSLDGGMSIC